MIGYMLTKRQAFLGHIDQVSQVFREIATGLAGLLAQTFLHVFGNVRLGFVSAFKRGGHGLPLIDGDKPTHCPGAQCGEHLPARSTSEGVVTRDEATVLAVGGERGAHGLLRGWCSCGGADLAQQFEQSVTQRPARLLCAAVHEVADRGLTATHLFGDLWLRHFSVTLNFGNNVFPVHARMITAFRLFGNVFSIPLFRKL
jgi:hypothetical protein